jgi:hypothetical protein
MLPSDKLQLLVEILVEKLNGETQNTKSIVLWLKLVLKGNLPTIITMPTGSSE